MAQIALYRQFCALVKQTHTAFMPTGDAIRDTILYTKVVRLRILIDIRPLYGSCDRCL